MTNKIAKKSQGTDQRAEMPRVSPRVDIYENDREFLIVADVPGVKADAVDARLEAGELRIHGTQSTCAEAQEFSPAQFARSFRIPDGVDPKGVKAEMKNGVLRVRLAKSEAARPRQIEVCAGC